MKRRTFLKAALYGTGGLTVLGSLSVLPRISPRPTDAAGMESETTVYSACEMCGTECPIAVKVKQGKVVKIEGNPNDADFGGVICARGNAGPSLLYDPKRLKKPLLHIGNERGDGKFKEVSWEEAYSYISDKIKKIQQQYGGESIVFTSRKGPHDDFFRSVASIIGSPNTFSHESMCPMTRAIALDTVFGNPGILADYSNARYIISLGRNWMEGIHVEQTRGIMKALEAGAKLVVLDPRFSVTASKGEWLPIKGTTDLAFVMAIANIMIAENLYDRDFIAQYTSGFDKWAETVKDKTPTWAEKETGLAAETIIRITREFAAAKPEAILDYGWRTALTPNDYQLRRAIMIVNVMIGNFEVPGGYFQKKSGKMLGKFPKYADIKPLGSVKPPSGPKPSKPRLDGAGIKGSPRQLTPVYDGAVCQITESILSKQPYPVKGWMVHRFNSVINMMDSERVIEAFKKLDLLVVCDLYLSDSAYYADVVLPECTYLERYDQIFDMSGLTPKYVLRQPVVPLVYPDTKPNWLIYKELGEKLGGRFNFTDAEDYLSQQLAGAGLTLAQLKEKGLWTPPGMKPFYVRGTDSQASLNNILGTKSKKIELFSQEVEEAAQEGVPMYKAWPQPAEGEFRFVQGKVAVHTNSGTANVPVLNELMPTNTLWINRQSAAKLGINDGDDLVIKAGKYEQKGKAKLTPGIRPDTVFAYHGFGRKSPVMKLSYGKGINDNGLIPNVLGEVGNAVTSMTFVTVQKA